MYHATSRVTRAPMTLHDAEMKVLMGLDKLRLISEYPPHADFLVAINAERALQHDQRRLDVQLRNPLEAKITSTTMATIASKRRAVPAYFLQMNFKVPGSGLVHIFETNPNKLPEGQRTLQQL